MKNKNRLIALVSVVILFCLIMTVVDGVIKADYFTKSAIKFVIFLVLPALYSVIDKGLELKPVFKLDKKGVKFALCLCLPLYAVILGGYLLLKDVFDFSAITSTLTSNIGVNRNNFVFVALYISFINSLLEEFFFRGFAFLTLARISSKRFAYIFSSAVFALYHVAMMIGWFNIYVFAIVMVGLFAGGMIFNYLNDKTGSIYPSWFVHMFANFAINTIGFMLFGII